MALDLGRRVMEVKCLERAGVQSASRAECAKVNMGFLNEATGECTCCSLTHTPQVNISASLSGSVSFLVVVKTWH